MATLEVVGELGDGCNLKEERMRGVSSEMDGASIFVRDGTMNDTIVDKRCGV